ncbi:MAG: hypothetical protein QNK03_00415 [Myxococcota bacterium]|nr:hypothetical protein [Myxococcota bacterium]
MEEPDRVPFDETPGAGFADAEDEYIEIRHVGDSTLNLLGVGLRMTDSEPEVYALGSAILGGDTVERYSPGSSAGIFNPGGVVVIGNPPGELEDDVFLEILALVGPLGNLEVGGNTVLRNFEADDDRDGRVDEDPDDLVDNDGDGLVDEDGPGIDPIRDGAPAAGATGASTGAADEALHRIARFAVDFRDFQRGAGTPGLAPSLGAALRINEIVTDPQRDWNDSVGPAGLPFDALPGTGAVDAGDEYIEIENVGPVTVRVRDFVLRMTDGTPVSYRIGSGAAGVVERASQGDIDALPPGAVLVIGNPPGELDDSVLVEIVDPCLGPIDSVEVGGNSAATNFGEDDDRDGRIDEDPLADDTDEDADGLDGEDGFGLDPVSDGAPAPGQDGAATGIADEALQRVGLTGNDIADFVRGPGDPGS